MDRISNPQQYASVSTFLNVEEFTALNLACTRSGKSRRRFVRDVIRAASGMPEAPVVAHGDAIRAGRARRKAALAAPSPK